MKWIDLPPIWLMFFCALTYMIGGIEWLSFTPTTDLLGRELTDARLSWGGPVFIAIGIVLTAAAVIEMAKHRTTVIPHRKADALVQTGIFAFSRNPIYLADMLILLGVIILLRAPVAIVFLPIFFLILRQRFILPEENMLFAEFGEVFDDYCDMTRRWI